jgi:hypothetical protein
LSSNEKARVAGDRWGGVRSDIEKWEFVDGVTAWSKGFHSYFNSDSPRYFVAESLVSKKDARIPVGLHDTYRSFRSDGANLFYGLP